MIGRDPIGLSRREGRSFSRAGGRGGEPLADGEFLLGDQCGGVLADRQAAAQPVGLGVVIDQHRRAVGVAGQAVPLQCADLSGPAAGVHEQLDRDPGLPAGDGLFQLGKMTADLAHDLGGDITAGLTRVCLGRDVAGGQGEVVRPGPRPGRRRGSAPESGSRSVPVRRPGRS